MHYTTGTLIWKIIDIGRPLVSVEVRIIESPMLEHRYIAEEHLELPRVSNSFGDKNSRHCSLLQLIFPFGHQYRNEIVRYETEPIRTRLGNHRSQAEAKD